MTTPPNTTTDFRWLIAFLVVMITCVGGSMFIAGAYVMPAILGHLTSDPLQGTQRIVELVAIFGAMALGLLITFVIITFAARRLIDTETFNRWQLQTENAQTPRPYKLIAALFLRAVRSTSNSTHAL